MDRPVLTSVSPSRPAAAVPVLPVDLNAVVKTVLESYAERLAQLQALLRCDALPVVNGAEDNLAALFASLFEMILAQPPKEGKLFIYIKCEETANLKIEGETVYAISLHTNCPGDAGWEKSYAAALGACGAICNESNGTFVYHLVSTNSCLFTLNLPGQLL